jgi:hypothetical protein
MGKSFPVKNPKCNRVECYLMVKIVVSLIFSHADAMENPRVLCIVIHSELAIAIT